MFPVKPMFSRRIHLLLKVMPATWLVNACFLGGDYFTERDHAPSETAVSEDTTATSDPSSMATASSRSVVPPSPSSLTSAPAETQSGEIPSDTSITDGARDGGFSNNEGVTDSSSSEVNTTTTPETNSSATSSVDGGNTDESSEPCYGFRCEEECNPDEEAGPDGGCFWFSRTQMTWMSAQTTCANRGQGWSVVTLHTPAEDAFVEEHIDTDTWIGAQYSGGSWRWVDDNTAFPANNAAGGDHAHANWGTNEPSGSKGENCARYHSYDSVWRWGDSKCNEQFAVACRGPGPGEGPTQ